MSVAIYTRVSTEEQKDDMQLHDLRLYAERAKMTDIVEYSDKLSGSKDSRPGLDRLLNDVRKRKVKTILVWRFDRFARSTRFLIQSLEEFKSLGVQFISFQENIDTDTPMGQVMFSIIAAMGQFERDILRQRVSAGMRVAKENGVILGRKRTVNTDEILKLKATGMSNRAIARQCKISHTSVMRALKRD